MEQFKQVVGVIAYGIEAFGVLIVVLGMIIATFIFLRKLKSHTMGELYPEYRRTIGRSIILGLEFLIAGDVIRTVIVSHDLTDVAMLALIVIIRAFLSFTLSLEIEGHWPWQTTKANDQKSGA